MLKETAYHKSIIDYYRETEHAYKDSWDLDNSLAIHYGYRDERAGTFRESLGRMNEVMMEKAAVKATDHVLDAGCGVGGSSIFLSDRLGCRVTGITLSSRQVRFAKENAEAHQLSHKVSFEVMDYCNTSFADGTFDVVWGCESVCYAENKEQFIREAFRLLKPGGRLVVADGFVTKKANNQHPVIRKWLDGWQVNYLETPGNFCTLMETSGFKKTEYIDITRAIRQSAKRLYRFYFLANLYLFWKKITFSKPPTIMQRKNIAACKYQFIGLNKKLWEYGIASAIKP